MFEFHSPDGAAPTTLGLVEVPKGITQKSELMKALTDLLHLPPYFAQNWDSLDECLGDLSWLPWKHTTLWHGDLPLEHDRLALESYLAVLNHAIAANHLTVSLPETAHDKIPAQYRLR